MNIRCNQRENTVYPAKGAKMCGMHDTKMKPEPKRMRQKMMRQKRAKADVTGTKIVVLYLSEISRSDI